MSGPIIGYLLTGFIAICGMFLVRFQYARDKKNLLRLAEELGAKLQKNESLINAKILVLGQPALTVSGDYKGYNFNISLFDQGYGIYGRHGYLIKSAGDKQLCSLRANRKYLLGDGIDYYALKAGKLYGREVSIKNVKAVIKSSNHIVVDDLINNEKMAGVIGVLLKRSVIVSVIDKEVSLRCRGLRRLTVQQIIEIMDAMVALADFTSKYKCENFFGEDPIKNPKKFGWLITLPIIIFIISVFAYLMIFVLPNFK
ncbi:MAG: hypothetical protein WCY36_04665 [Candidatus Omnitrophota bacterium]